jgi:hypothetical protein
MFVFATTLAAPVTVMLTSANVFVTITVVAVAESLAGFVSVVELDAVAVLLIVNPDGAVASVFTTTEKFAVAAFAIVGVEHAIVPVPPTAGVMQVQPAGRLIDWNVVYGGMFVANVTWSALFGPLFVRACA